MSNYYDYEDDIDFMDDWDFLDEYSEAEKEEKKRRRFKTVKYISAGLLFVVAVALAVVFVIKTGILEDKKSNGTAQLQSIVCEITEKEE